VTGGLTRRVAIASALLTLVVVAGFIAVLLAIDHLRESTQSRRDIRQELVAANALQTLVIDLESGLLGYVLARDDRSLETWNDARADFPGQARTLERGAAGEPVQLARIRLIEQDVASYVRDYALPIFEAARRNDPSARSLAATPEGSRRIDAIREEFTAFLASGGETLAARERSAESAGRLAVAGAAVGAAGSILLILLFAGYLTRVIVRPVRQTALMADRLAGGDLSARMSETDVGEIGALERSFNVMADSLEKDRDELARLAEEHAALRRVATLVARGTPAGELFAAVAEEVGQLLPVDLTHMGRYGSDGTVTVVAGWSGTGDHLAVGARLPLGGENVSTLVSQTGRPARMGTYADDSDPLTAAVRASGIRSSVGTPIIVEGRLWGVMIAASALEQPLPSRTEERLADFTDLVATAVANAESRADLAASRARIVATADATRRRIERDLHDGAQQRLVSLALELRAAQAAVPPEVTGLEDDLSHLGKGLESVMDELREMARGIHPAILAEGGLGPALKTLARRSPIPVQLDVRTEGRLPERVEVAAYYVVSETITNAVKHAHASVVHVDVEALDGVLRVSVGDDGAGGADSARGSGLVGLKDRVEALGGAITVQSPLGGGTSVRVELPLND
jgi:signal transduction histidine kinase